VPFLLVVVRRGKFNIFLYTFFNLFEYLSVALTTLRALKSKNAQKSFLSVVMQIMDLPYTQGPFRRAMGVLCVFHFEPLPDWLCGL
jgi:hypothetical protein